MVLVPPARLRAHHQQGCQTWGVDNSAMRPSSGKVTLRLLTPVWSGSSGYRLTLTLPSSLSASATQPLTLVWPCSSLFASATQALKLVWPCRAMGSIIRVRSRSDLYLLVPLSTPCTSSPCMARQQLQVELPLRPTCSSRLCRGSSWAALHALRQPMVQSLPLSGPKSYSAMRMHHPGHAAQPCPMKPRPHLLPRHVTSGHLQDLVCRSQRLHTSLFHTMSTGLQAWRKRRFPVPLHNRMGRVPTHQPISHLSHLLQASPTGASPTGGSPTMALPLLQHRRASLQDHPLLGAHLLTICCPRQ